MAVLVVVSFTGTWIETRLCSLRRWSANVVSFTGTWIETMYYPTVLYVPTVVSFTGTWIETGKKLLYSGITSSYPLRVRGLKPITLSLLIIMVCRILYGYVD